MYWMKCLPALLALLCCGADAEDRRSPNILFFLVDDQRNDTLGCAGHPVVQTPHVDRLAENGVRFTDAYVTTSICAASRASILTGLRESAHGYTFGKPPVSKAHMDASYPTLLREAGYRTGFVGKFGVGIADQKPADMFDVFVPINRNPYHHPQPDGSTRHETELAGDAAERFLESHDAGQPFCLSVSFNAVHAEDADKEDHFPWPKAVDRLYDDVDIPAPALGPEYFEVLPEFLRESMNRDRWYWRWDTPEKYDKNMRAYFRMITGVDRVVGRVMKRLEEAGLADNTIVVYSADNGYYMGDRGFAGKWSHFEQSLRVPMIVFDPRADTARRGLAIDPLALNIDLPATFLDWAGLTVPEHYHGRSLAPLLAGTTGDWRTHFLCEHHMDHPDIPKWRGVHTQRYVYANYYEQDPPYEFLHDLYADPTQHANFAHDPAYEEVLNAMRAQAAE